MNKTNCLKLLVAIMMIVGFAAKDPNICQGRECFQSLDCLYALS